jgi:hypothetical protein
VDKLTSDCDGSLHSTLSSQHMQPMPRASSSSTTPHRISPSYPSLPLAHSLWLVENHEPLITNGPAVRWSSSDVSPESSLNTNVWMRSPNSVGVGLQGSSFFPSFSAPLTRLQMHRSARYCHQAVFGNYEFFPSCIHTVVFSEHQPDESRADAGRKCCCSKSLNHISISWNCSPWNVGRILWRACRCA